jgi:Spy/CpxP family protein refolding chaperone
MSTNPETTPKARSSKTRIIAILAAGTLAVGGIFSVQAIAGSNTFQHLTTEIGYKGHWRGGDHKRFSEMTEEEIQSRVTRVVKHVAIEIDATDEQTDKIVTLVMAVANDMKPLHEKMHASREEIQALLLSEQIDRTALEALRAARVAEVDQMSKTLIEAVADAAEVLTLEQRKVLEERVREFRKMFGGHRRDHGWKHHDRT